ncbi:O-antigen ligase family protein [Chloroflexota bacterium]
MQVQKTFLIYFDKYRSTIFVLVISVGILILSWLLGYRVNRLPLMLIFGATGGMVFILIALKRMNTAITLLIASSATLPLTISTGTATPLHFSMLVLALLTILWIFRMGFIDKRIRLIPSPINLPFLGFVLTAMVSWLVGYVIWDWRIQIQDNLFFVQLGQFAIFAMSVAALLLVSNHSIDEKELKLWTAVLICMGVVTYLYWTFVRYGPPSPQMMGSVLMWPILLVWAQLMFNPKLKTWMHMGGILMTLLWAYWVYSKVLVWKGGWFPAVMGFFLLLFFKSRRVFFIVLIILGLLVALNWEALGQYVVGPEIASGSTLRTLYWYDVIRMTSRSVLLGLGPANYEFYWSDPTFIPLSRIAAGWDVWNEWGFSPPSHNSFVDIFSQTGLIGLIFFMWGLIAALVICYRLLAKFKPGFQKAYIYAVMCGTISLAVASFWFADWLLPFVYNINITGFAHTVYTWLLLGSVIALSNLSKGARDDQDT